jgi:hypothetical protein
MRTLFGTRRRIATVVLVLGAGVALVVAGGAFGRTPDAAPTSDQPTSTVDLLDRSIAQSQERLKRLPGDWHTWASLGLAYLERARITTDPTYYPKAEEAVRRSLQVRPDDNPDALIAQGALANARHDFAAAREHALAAVALNAYSPEAYAVLTDAETQLGHPRRPPRRCSACSTCARRCPATPAASYDFEAARAGRRRDRPDAARARHRGLAVRHRVLPQPAGRPRAEHRRHRHRRGPVHRRDCRPTRRPSPSNVDRRGWPR